jgi:hypothetical protein
MTPNQLLREKQNEQKKQCAAKIRKAEKSK